MSAETKKVLEMLAEGKITADDAERLLDKLAAGPEKLGAAPEFKVLEGGEPAATASTAAPKKFLRVQMERPGGNEVNVRVPLNFVRSGVKLAGILPPKVLEKLQQEGIDPKIVTDFAQQARESVDVLDDLHVDMETRSGKRIRVFAE
jgi:hypothetical protein